MDRKDWLKQRLGVFTGSDIYKLCSFREGKLIKGVKGKKGKNGEPDIEEIPDSYDTDFFPDGAKEHALKKAAEMLTTSEVEEHFKSKAMLWGNETEMKAVAAIEERYGLTIEKCGDEQELIKLGNDIGCTPDGLIGDDGLLEIKCPESFTHIKYLQINSINELKEQKPEYYWQMQHAMYVTGRRRCLFVSYDPRFELEHLQMKTMLVYRNEEDILFLDKRIKQAIAYRNEVLDSVIGTDTSKIIHNKTPEMA